MAASLLYHAVRQTHGTVQTAVKLLARPTRFRAAALFIPLAGVCVCKFAWANALYLDSVSTEFRVDRLPYSFAVLTICNELRLRAAKAKGLNRWINTSIAFSLVCAELTYESVALHLCISLRPKYCTVYSYLIVNTSTLRWTSVKML